MRPLIFAEIDEIVTKLKPLVGSQLQEVWQSGAQLGLGFYHAGVIEWLWIDLHPREPVLVKLSSVPRTAKKQTKPLSLFLKAHLVGQRLREIEINFKKGRVIWLVFFNGKIELRLFAKGQNVIVEAGEKSVSFEKVKDLVAQETEFNEAVTASVEARSWQQITDEWLAKNQLAPRNPASRPSAKNTAETASPAPDALNLVLLQDPQSAQAIAEKQFQKDVEKKETALRKIGEDLIAKQNPIWRKAGDWLKSEGPQKFPHLIPDEFAEVIDPQMKLSPNIENVFKKAKDNDRKLEGSRERMQQIQGELDKLKARGPQLSSAKTPPVVKQKSLLERASVRGRRFEAGEGLEGYIGKSAADNLALLRKAQPFDYWLHLRDYPGSHAILRRSRNRIVTDAEFNEAGRWVVQQSLGKNANELKGGKYDLLIVECRYVRPIKGDKLGRVNYSNDRVLTIRM